MCGAWVLDLPQEFSSAACVKPVLWLAVSLGFDASCSLGGLAARPPVAGRHCFVALRIGQGDAWARRAAVAAAPSVRPCCASTRKASVANSTRGFRFFPPGFFFSLPAAALAFCRIAPCDPFSLYPVPLPGFIAQCRCTSEVASQRLARPLFFYLRGFPCASGPRRDSFDAFNPRIPAFDTGATQLPPDFKN